MDPPPGSGIEAELALERREKLAELLLSDGWTLVLRPLLVRRAEAIARKLVTGRGLSLEEMRLLQGEHRALLTVVGTTVDDLKRAPEE